MNEERRITELKERLAQTISICVCEELLENFGHVSARDPESQRILVLRHLHERLDRVTANDFIEVTEYGKPIRENTEPPKEVLLHTAIYRQRKDVNGIVYSHPLYSTVLGILGRQILPLLTNCHFIKSGIRVFDVPQYIGNSQTAELMINELGSSVALLLREWARHRGRKYSGSNATLDFDRTVGQGAVHGVGDRRPEGDCRC
jgi:ribulose-5-phosphate 4-epimerase/fuculose-1-phosphate aldolase